MGNSNKNQKPKTEEQKNETVQPAGNQQSENPVTENPAQGGGDTQPTPPGNAGGDNQPDETPTDKTGGDGDKPEVTPPEDKNEKAKKVKLVLRHKSHTPHYHRCGLTLTKVFAEYEVPEDCVARLKADKWVEVKGSK